MKLKITGADAFAFWSRIVYYSVWAWIAYESFRITAGV